MKQLTNLSDREFKVMVIKVLFRLEGQVDELSKNLHKEIENTFKKTNQR